MILFLEYFFYSDKMILKFYIETANCQIFLVEPAHVPMKAGALNLTRDLGMIQE